MYSYNEYPFLSCPGLSGEVMVRRSDWARPVRSGHHAEHKTTHHGSGGYERCSGARL